MRKLFGLTMVLVCLLSVAGCTQGKPAPEEPTPEATPSAAVDIQTTLDKPPKMTVVPFSGAEEVVAMNGSYSWSHLQEDGLTQNVIACGEGMPERLRDMMSPMSLPAAGEPMTAALRFGDAPDSVSVRSWAFNDPQVPGVDWDQVEVHELDGNLGEFQIELKDGGYIYEVTAEWNEGGTYWGSAVYHFRADKQP